ncbi:beta-ribofuranosylaminobenzene 5'-phosphate synthase [Thauera sinica]|nr:beta-ribofuranosylaminobenzene 5'-phosphate synthase [Thauera sp. K11]
MIRQVAHAPGPDALIVDAPARLHLGFMDPGGSLGRRYASLGLVIGGLNTRIGIAAAAHNRVEVAAGVDAAECERLQRHLDTLQARTGRDLPLRVTLLRAPPAHSGFGSGTQLALALGHAFARHHRLDMGSADIAGLLGRGERSGVGIAGFDRGGLLLDCGPGADGSAAPLVSRIEFPEAWRVVLVLDGRATGLCGSAEREAMAALPPFPRERAADICHQVLMRVLPGAIERDFAPFAEGVSAIQRLMGGYFAPAQGGSMYTSRAVGRVIDWISRHRLAAVGQSSWGPTGFAILPGEDEAERAVDAARGAGVVDPALRILIAGGRNHGARICAAADFRSDPGD